MAWYRNSRPALLGVLLFGAACFWFAGRVGEGRTVQRPTSAQATGREQSSGEGGLASPRRRVGARDRANTVELVVQGKEEGEVRSTAAPSSTAVTTASLHGVLVHPGETILELEPSFPRLGVSACDVRGGWTEARITREGSYEFPWLEPGDWVLKAFGSARVPRWEKVTLLAGEDRTLDLFLDPLRTVEVLFRDETGDAVLPGSAAATGQVRGFEDGELVTEWEYDVLQSVSFVLTDGPVRTGTLRGEGDLEPGKYRDAEQVSGATLPAEWGDGIFCLLSLPEEETGFVTYLITGIALESRPLADRGRIEFSWDSAERAALVSSISCRLVSEEEGGGVPEHGSFSVGWRLGGTSFRAGRGQSIRVEGVLPGYRELSVRGDGIETVTEHVRLAPGTEEDLGDVRVQGLGILQGRVLTREGEPVSYATIHGWRLGRDGTTHPAGDSLGSANDPGDYRIELPPGRSFLRVSSRSDRPGPQGGGRSVEVWIRPGEPAIADLIIAPLFRVVCRTLDVRARYVLFEDGNGVELARKRWRDGRAIVSFPMGAVHYRILDVTLANLAKGDLTVREGLEVDL